MDVKCRTYHQFVYRVVLLLVRLAFSFTAAFRIASGCAISAISSRSLRVWPRCGHPDVGVISTRSLSGLAALSYLFRSALVAGLASPESGISAAPAPPPKTPQGRFPTPVAPGPVAATLPAGASSSPPRACSNCRKAQAVEVCRQPCGRAHNPALFWSN